MPFTVTVEKGSLVGTQIGPYQLTRVIGEGGMGSVFEAVHKALGRRVAIKVMKAVYAADPESLTRLFNEARAVNLIDHPGLVQISEFGELPDGCAYLVMELLRGDTLTTRLRRSGGRLAEKSALAVASQLASVLAAAHEKEIVHRDLKPSNVMLVGDMMVAGGERVKLLDFGIAKLNKTNTQEADPQTRAGVLLGTPRYMSPEQCLGRIDIDGKSDVYALGVMMFEMLTGQMPFKTPSEVALVAAHIYEQPTPLRELAPNVNIAICTLVDQMLRKKKEERPSMIEVARRIGERTSHQVEEQATARISSLPDKETLRAMLNAGAIAGQVAGGASALPPPASASGALPALPGGAPRIPTPPSMPGIPMAPGSSSGALMAVSVGDSPSAMTPVSDPLYSTTLRGSSGQRSPVQPARFKIVGGVAIASLLVLGLGSLWFARRSVPAAPPPTATSPETQPATPPVAPPKPVLVHWSIESEPAGAEVVRVGSDEVLGTTPFQQEREASPGSEQLKLRLAGYQESLITVPLGRDVSVDRSLAALPKPAEPTPPTVAKPAPAPPKKTIAKRPVAKSKAGKKPAGSPGVF
ncbi:MAG TPA: protein kinase [Pseudomonadota bacterium]|nr:protein kinase [Pseudomonadota bacterium]